MQRRVEDYREQVICTPNAADIPQEISLRINNCLTKSRFAVDRKVYEARRGRRLKCVVSSFVHSHALIFFSLTAPSHILRCPSPRFCSRQTATGVSPHLGVCWPSAYLHRSGLTPVTAPPVWRASLISRVTVDDAEY